MRNMKIIMLATSVALSMPCLVRAEKFTVATWNIGHFAMGLSESKIPQEAVEKRSAEYRAFLRGIGAKILTISEYSHHFDRDKAVLTRDAMLKDYASVFESGKIDGGHNNALAVNGFLAADKGMVPFKSHYQQTNFRMAEVQIGGDSVLVVASHLEPNWPTNHRAMRAEQIRQILAAVAGRKHVIIGLDSNVETVDEWKPFVDAGFASANDGTYMTWHVSEPKTFIDTIFVKGFRISDVKVHNQKDLSDHLPLSCSLEKLTESKAD